MFGTESKILHELPYTNTRAYSYASYTIMITDSRTPSMHSHQPAFRIKRRSEKKDKEESSFHKIKTEMRKGKFVYSKCIRALL